MVVYLLLLNALGLGFMYADKQFAIRHRRRIPEATLLLLAAAGGSLGCWLGMALFRHKTRHRKFTLGLPLILLAQLALWFALGSLGA